MNQAERARRFRSLHVPGTPLRLMNAWDAGSARLFEVSGSPAIGTSSAGVAFALGRPDGQQIGRTEVIDAVGRISGAVAVPVSGDIESGFGEGFAGGR